MAYIDWNQIDTVFLDMDGTLLDLHFDNHFWLEHVPMRYAQAKGLSTDTAKQQLLQRYRELEGTLNWYCVDHWSRELDLDIVLLKQEIEHLVSVHPHVPEFMSALEQQGKRRVLVTNAHHKTVAFKMQRTALHREFDQVLSSHRFGLPKESPGFWERVHEVEPFDPQRTLFVDDNLAVLRAARTFGFRWLLAVTRPDRSRPVQPVADFLAIENFSFLLPELIDR